MIDWVFARNHALPFSLSRQIDRDKRSYYHALQSGRQVASGGIDATAFVVWFLLTLDGAAKLAQDDIHFILRRNQYRITHRENMNDRQIKLFEVLFAQGPSRIELGIAAKTHAKITSAASATATRDLAKLEIMGILSRTAAGGRSTRYKLCR